MSVLLTNKLIAGAVHGKNESWLFRIRLELLPQMNDVRVDRARVGIIFITPNRVQQTIAAERLNRMRDKISEQGKLFC